MKKIIIMMFSVAAAFGFVACNDPEQPISNDITPSNQLLLPRNNTTAILKTGNNFYFEWEVSKAENKGYVTYEVLFDKADGDFSNPLYIYASDNNGYKPSANISSETLNTIAVLAGAALGETAPVKWTVRAWSGATSQIYGSEQGVRNFNITRVYTFDPAPIEVLLSGDITEDGKKINFINACPVFTKRSSANNNRTPGVFECFTKLKAGKLQISDDRDRFVKLADKNTIQLIVDKPEDQSTDKTAYEIESEGIYWIYLDYNTMSYDIKQISKVEVWTNPWWGPSYKDAMSYTGDGVWTLTYKWNIGTPSENRIDSRYKFLCTYTDGSVERWSYIQDDCRDERENPNGTPNFFNVYRFTNNIEGADNWGHTWKTNEKIQEGLGKEVTFNVYMNNKQNGYFIHTRSFK